MTGGEVARWQAVVSFGIQSLRDGRTVKDVETHVLGMSSSIEGVAAVN